MGFFGSLFGIKKMNADPVQQLLARKLIEAAESSAGHTEFVNWLCKQEWAGSGPETRDRITHALSIVKVSSVPATYERAKEIGLMHYQASYRLAP